jgi:hypothetical protein
MTTIQNAAVDQVPADGETMRCDVCGHTFASHDRIAERYCQATLHNALPRTCICSLPNDRSRPRGACAATVVR